MTVLQLAEEATDALLGIVEKLGCFIMCRPDLIVRSQRVSEANVSALGAARHGMSVVRRSASAMASAPAILHPIP